MVTNPGEIGSLRRNVKLQRQLAANSAHYVCPKCNIHHQNLKHVVGTVGKFPTATTVATTKLLFRMDDAVAASADANNSNSGRRPSPEANQVQRGGSKSKSRVVRGQTTRALRRLQFMRKVVLYSGAALLLAGWKYCCAWLENYLLFGRDSLQSL